MSKQLQEDEDADLEEGDEYEDDSGTDDEIFEERDAENFLEMARAYGAVDEDGDYPGFCWGCSKGIGDWFWNGPFCLRDFACDELKKYMPRVGFAFLVCAIGLYINMISQAWLQHTIGEPGNYYQLNWNATLAGNPPINHSVVLYDLGFAIMPLNPYVSFMDNYVTSSGLIMATRFIIVPGPLSLRWTIASRFLFIWGIMWMLRGISIAVTPLPNPMLDCVPKVTAPDNILLEAFYLHPLSFGIGGPQLTCQDVMFSGHTVLLTLTTMVWFRCLPVTPWFQISASRRCFSLSTLINVGGVTWLLIGYLLIISTRFHYTVDVFVGLILTVMVCNLYDNKIRVSLMQSTKQRSYSNWILWWFELHSKDLIRWHNRTLSRLELQAALENGHDISERHDASR